jgi:sterol desaturase/sphingolipid hydroxylase (fatty acid hydroxylase superfamily)
MNRWYPILTPIAMLTLVVLAELAERLRPARRVDRRAEWKLDILAALVVFSTAQFFRDLLVAALDRAGLGVASAPLVAALRAVPVLVRLPLALLVLDLGMYALHRAMHASPRLWRAHAFHHTTRQLYWFSGFRTSVLQVLLYAAPQAVLVVFFAFTPGETFSGAVFGLFVQLFQHANTRVALGPVGWLVVTPAYHRYHHAADAPRAGNYGNMFTVWDRVFGTWVDPHASTVEYTLGVTEKTPRARMLEGV